MSLRIPLTKDQTLQVEFHEVERRLRRLEKGLGVTPRGGTTIQVLGGGASSVDESDIRAINDRIDALEGLIDELSDPATSIADFGAEGASAMRGLVPAPLSTDKPTGIAEAYLQANATWAFPFRGLIQVVTSGDQTTQTTPPGDVISINANVNVAGIIGGIFSGKILPTGYLACNQDELDILGY